MPLLYGHAYSRRELFRRVGRLEQVGGVRLVTAGDSVERGVRVLEFRTGPLEFDVLIDRGFDIGRCELRGFPIAWQSATGVTGPWYYEPEGLGFLRSFGGGLLTTCGLDHALFMAEDTAVQYHYPPKRKESYGLHGRISNRPAKLCGYGEHWVDDDCVLWAEGEILQAAVFGEQLLLRRRIEARIGHAQISVHDEVENIGYAATPHMLLYHMNVGWPIVEENSELLAPTQSVTERSGTRGEGYRLLHGPRKDFVEQVYEHRLAGDSTQTVPVAIVNRELGVGAWQTFSQAQLPHHFVWRMLGEGTYVVGIEPSTNRVDGRLPARARGELIELEPGERRVYDLELGALDGTTEIEAFAQRVHDLISRDEV